MTLVAAFAGPLRFEILGAEVSIRTLSRPLIAALLLLTVRSVFLDRRAYATAAAHALARITCGSMIAAGAIGWLTYLSPTCGGADSYGYVSAAERIVAGNLVREEPLAAVLPFENSIRAACPLGYVPSGRVANASVPAYPLGLPGLMAVARTVGGRDAGFSISPLFGVVLLGASFLTSLAWYRERHLALLTCGLVALHPLVFTYAIQPMSDVPAAAMLLLSVAALSRTPMMPFSAGVAAALTLLIRPALALVGLALAIVPWAESRERRVTAVAQYLAPLVVAIAFQTWLQWYLYGDVVSSGYGGIGALFSTDMVRFNARSYAYWGFLTLGPVWVAAGIIGAAISGRLPRRVLLVITIAVALPYLLYRPYDHWETLRFLLPILVIATIVGAAGLLWVARRIAGEAVGALLASAVAVAMAYGWISWLSAQHVFTMPEHEARHRIVGELVAQSTPADAVILALQHSGSVRYYAERQTLNWDQIPAGSFNAAVQTLRNRGHSVFVIIDSAEERAMFEARHGRVLQDPGWLPAGQRRDVQMWEAK